MSSNRLIHQFATPEDAKKETSKTPLELHMECFAAPDGFVDQESIYKACSKVYPEADAKAVAVNTMRGAYYCGVPGVSFSLFGGIQGRFKPKDAIALVTHPKDSGLFARYDGSFNEALFQILVDKYAITSPQGEKIISRAKLDEFSAKETNQDGRWKDASRLFSHLGALSNKGEFDLFYKGATWCYVTNEKTKEKEGYVKIADLKQWYINSQLVLDKMARHELPTPAP